MTESHKDKGAARELTAETVIEWLKCHPDFLKKHPDAADALIPPKKTDNGRSVADFQHYMLEKLKADKKMVLDTTRDIIEISRENMQNLARIHTAVLRLLEAEGFDDYVQILTEDLGPVLECDAVSLIVEDADGLFPDCRLGYFIKVAPGTVDRWMAGNNARIQSGVTGEPGIFGAAAPLVRSQALLRIDERGLIPPAMMAFGSRDPDLFRDGQGVDLIAFLCGVVERTLRQWKAR